MKKLLATAATVLVTTFALPSTAEAGVSLSIGSEYTYVSGHASCGSPIYTKRIVRGFDRFRKPIYSYHRLPFRSRAVHLRSGHSGFRQHGFVHRGNRNFHSRQNFRSNRNFHSRQNFQSNRNFHSKRGFSNHHRGNFGHSRRSFRR